MSGILDQPRTITLRGRPHRFETFASLAGLGDAYVQALRESEAKMATEAIPAAEWAGIADTADALVEVCRELEGWLAEHDAALAVEAEAIRADIRMLTALNANEVADEQA